MHACIYRAPPAEKLIEAAELLHEFGHSLFCIHEHQNPVTTIPWDKDAVHRYYKGPPNYWTGNYSISVRRATL